MSGDVKIPLVIGEMLSGLYDHDAIDTIGFGNRLVLFGHE